MPLAKASVLGEPDFVVSQQPCSLRGSDKSIGDVWVGVDGHQGENRLPEIPTQPTQLMAAERHDFGCYGADLVTCSMDERRPGDCNLQQIKPEIYPRG
jgi:hypothetical protein